MKPSPSARSRCFVVGTLSAAAIALGACTGPDDGEASESDVVAGESCAADRPRTLARIASRVDGLKSQMHCYRFVKAHLRAAGVSTVEMERAGYGASAAMFAEFAKANPLGLARMGLTKVTPPLDALPQGAILVWHRGQCGYDKTHGHIEIVMGDDSARACSDFCGRIRKDCGLPDVFVFAACPAPASAVNGSNANADEVDDSEDEPADVDPAAAPVRPK